jgi:hypothetical protein
MMLLEDILRKGFSKGICNLILGSYWEDLNKPIPYVFAKVMVTYVDVLGMRQSFGSLASSNAPELSSKTLQYTWGLVKIT